MNGVIWLIVLPGMLFAAGAYAQISPAPDDNGGTTPGAVPAKFDAGFYQKIQDLIESDRTGLQDSHQKTRDPAGPRGTSGEYDGELYYNIIIVVDRNGQNPDDTTRQNKESIARHLESLGARDIVAAESLSFVTASVPVSKIPGLSLREEVRQMGDGELPVTPLVGDRARQTIHATPSDLRQSSGIVPNGTGVVVAVIDSGGINNPYLNDKVAERVTCGPDGCRLRSAAGSSTTLSHGTYVAGALAASGLGSNDGIAPGVTLLDVKYAFATYTSVAHGLDWSSSKADVANLSFGTGGCPEDLFSSYSMIINEATDKGLVIVAAAGNAGYIGDGYVSGPRYQIVSAPACVHNVIAAGGVLATRYYGIAPYNSSSKGPTSTSEPRLAPDIVAPSNVRALENSIDGSSTRGSGTSLSTPQVSAAAAILLQVSPELTPAGIRAALLLGADWTGPVPCTSAQYEQNNTDDPCSYAMQPADPDTAYSLEILNNVGFGILDVAGSLGYANSSSSHIMSDYLDAAIRTRTYEFNVTDTSEPAKVILTWMIDSHLSPADLNLEILAPNGSVINASSVHQTTEFAVFRPNATGTYTVTVRGSGFGLPDRPVQTFALAGTSGLAAIPLPDPPLPPDPAPPAPLAINPEGRKSAWVDRTLRIDLQTTGGAGPVTWSIDEKPGARIHPDTGHLVYLPPPGTRMIGLTQTETLTVRADDGNDTVPMDIDVQVTGASPRIEYVRPSSENLTVLEAKPNPAYSRYHISFGTFSDGAFTLRSDVVFILEPYFHTTLSSDPYTLPPQPDELHIFRVYGGFGNEDINHYAQVTPGKEGYEIIPNPFTRPDPFAPSFDHIMSAGTAAPIRPGLVGFDGDPLFITDAATDGSMGTADHTNTTITYTSNTNTAGTDTITYTVTDNRGRTGTGTINITVFPPITVNDDTVRTDEDTPVSIDVLGNDTASGARLSASDPMHGNATVVQSNNTITYAPNRNYHGPDMFTYTVTDGINATVSGTVRITVRSVNDLPMISGLENMTINELKPLNITIAVTDADNTTDQLTLTTEYMGEPGLPEGMQMTKERLTWTPTEPQGPGAYPFTIRIGDGLDQTARGFVFTVSEVNQDPQFNITGTDSIATQGIEFMLDMNVTDADLPEQEITCSITSQETGTVPAQINPQTCIITWTPADLGDHVISVQAEDDLGGATPITAININVRFNDVQAPVITLNNATQNPQIIELGDEYEELGATASDDDPSYAGTVDIDSSRVDVNNTGTYTVTYTATPDPAGKTPEPVTRNVTVQDTTKPVIALIGPSNQIVDYGGTYMEQNATVTDNDPGYTGTVSIDTPEIDSRIENATHTVTYSAPADDAGNVPDIKTRTLTIGLQSAAPNQNPVARDATLNITEDSGKSTVRPEIFDPDMSGTLVIISVGTPSKGEADFNATDNTITYRPGQNEYGPDSFNYTIRDNRHGNATGTVTVNITPVNDPPELGMIDDITLDELELRTITLNATDVDNTTDSLVWTHAGGPEGLDITGNLLAWEPAESQGPGDHPFVITVSDSIDTVSQQVTFTVNEVNQDPVLHQGDVTATRNVLRQFQINATDSDIPPQTLTYRFETGSTVPTGANMSDTGHFSWTPAEEHSGARHVIAITVDDGAGGRTTGSFAIRVDGVGDPPAPGNIIVPGGDNTVIAPASNATIGRILEAYMSRGLVVYAGGPQPGLAGSSGAGFLLAGIIINGTYADSAGPADWNVTDPDDIAVFVREIGNVPPILSGTGDYTINADDTLTFAVSATDYNDTVSYRLSDAPNGAEISRQGGFSWTPGSADIDTHTFTITAHDGQNATDTESVTVRVLPAGTTNGYPTAPDVAATVAPDGRIIIIPAISDPDGDPVRITGARGDAGGTIVSSDNSIEYTAGPNPGTETVTYTVRDSRGVNATGTITIIIR